MEVKIKTANGLKDATIEMVDGDMIVSPKEQPKYTDFKEGDIVVSNYNDIHLLRTKNSSYFAFRECGYFDHTPTIDVTVIRPATEEEKKKLFDKLAEAGYEWDAEKKEIVKLKWKLKVGEDYYTPSWNGYVFEPYLYGWSEDEFDFKCYSMGRVFKTKEECQAFCNKLNEAINSVEP